jgi:recombination protein RecA
MAKEVLLQQPTGKTDKFKQILVLAKQLNENLKTTNSIVRMGSRVGLVLPSIPTKLPTLDNDVIGTGGVPRGRIIEIFGPESAGKTTVALYIIACEQSFDPNAVCAFVDAEHALDPNYATLLGVNVDELLVSQPDCGEDALTIVEQLIESKTVSLIVVDSVAALVPRAELEGEMGDSHMGLQARLMSQAMRKLNGIASKNNVTVVFINQIREKIGVMFGSPETTTGGRALKFFSSVRLDVRRRKPIKSGDAIVGHEIEIKAVKNKVGTPFRSTTVDLIYNAGFDTMKNFVQYAISVGAIEQAGAWYKFNGNQIGQGEGNTIEMLRNDKNLLGLIEDEVKKAQKTLKEQ